LQTIPRMIQGSGTSLEKKVRGEVCSFKKEMGGDHGKETNAKAS